MKLPAIATTSFAVLLLLTASAHALDLGVQIGVDAGIDLSQSEANADASAGSAGSLQAGDIRADVALSTKVVTSASFDAGTTGANGVIDINDVIELIAQSEWSQTSLRGLIASDLRLIDAEDVISNGRAELDAVLAARDEDVADLQTAVAANASFAAWLDANSLNARSVVGLGVSTEGGLVLVIHRTE